MNLKLYNKFKYKQLLARGIKESRSGKYLDAIQTFTLAINENPMNYEVYYNRGLSYLILKKLDKAENDLNATIRLNPNYSNGFYIRGTIYQAQNRIWDAIFDFEQAIKLNPTNADSYLKCAVLYGKLDYRDTACSYLKKACNYGNYKGCYGYSKFCE